MDYIVVPRLNELLKDRNITQVQLSQMTGIQQGTLSRFDKNKQHMDTHLFLISRALGLTIEELFRIIPRDPNKYYIDIDLPEYKE